MNEKFYTVDQVAKALQVHKKTVVNLIKKGKLLAVNIGGDKRATYRIYEAQLIRFIAESYPEE